MLRTLRTIYCATRIAVALIALSSSTAFAATLSTDPANVGVPAIDRLSEVVAFAERDDVPDAPPVVSASERTALTDADDELWYISSRAARHAPDGTIRLHYWQYDDAGNWQTRTREQFLAADPALPLCFHVHGNRVTNSQANLGGWRYFTTFTSGCHERPPLRFVIFSWPSERLCSGRNSDDLRTKAVRAECHAFYFAWLVDQLPAETRIGMVGFSYGARLIGGALHLLGGGSVRGQRLVERENPEPRAVRAIFLAGALDDDHFLPGRCFHLAPTQLEQLLVARNCCDPALRWYPLLYGFMLRPKNGQQAMGYSGIVGVNYSPLLAGRVEQRDVSALVGKSHEWHACEFLAGSFLERMRQYVYFEPLK